MYIYCFTLRNLIKPDPDSIIRIIDVLKKYLERVHIEYHWEIVFKKNGKHNVHVHGMMKSHHVFDYVAVHKKIPKGFSFYINPCDNEQAWILYMTKSRLTLEQIRKLINTHIYNDERSEQTHEEQNNFVTEQSGSDKHCHMQDLEDIIEICPFDQRKIIE